MTREETLEAIKVMQHYADGGEIELYDSSSEEWVSAFDFDNEPSWIWTYNKYRIKKTKKKIKLYAWIDYEGQLCWITTDSWKRVQSEYKWVEVEE